MYPKKKIVQGRLNILRKMTTFELTSKLFAIGIWYFFFRCDN